MDKVDRNRALWFLLALVVIFVQGLYTNHRQEWAAAEAMIDADEIKALVRWVGWRAGNP